MAGACDGTVYQCGDGIDNDGDGLVDLADPECISVCDDDEASYQTGIPGDNMDCKQDCFFDGNSGAGDDGCEWNLKCDPANPGANIGCAYTGSNSCNNMSPTVPQECLDLCTPRVPNGCDCFGCCTVQTDMGPVNVFLNSSPDCSESNLAACQSCTISTECGNPCEPEMCEVCFGETEPPEGCGEPTCPEGQQACTQNPDGTSDCPPFHFCLTGCCVPADPPG